MTISNTTTSETMGGVVVTVTSLHNIYYKSVSIGSGLYTLLGYLTGIPSYKVRTMPNTVNMVEIYSYIRSLISHETALYHKKIIITGSGKRRECWVPKESLKILQREVNDVLRKYPMKGVSSMSTSYIKHIVRKRSYETVLSMDIKDFFPSIKTPRLCNEIFNYINPTSAVNNDEKESFVSTINSLFTYDGFLPQGAPTSPIISDLFMYSSDKYFRNYLNKYIPGAVYLRYVDNFFILLPAGTTEDQVKKLQGTIHKALFAVGLNINNKKTSWMKRNQAMNILGMTSVVVPEQSKEYIKVVDGNPVVKKLVSVYSTMRVSGKYTEEVYRYLCWMYNEVKVGGIITDKEYQSAIGKVMYIKSVNKKLKGCFSKLMKQLLVITDHPKAIILSGLINRDEEKQ